jgi:hypothetical protein
MLNEQVPVVQVCLERMLNENVVRDDAGVPLLWPHGEIGLLEILVARDEYNR